VIDFSGNGMPEENRTVALGRFTFEKMSADGGRAVALADVPPVLLSETWCDAQDIAREGTGFDPAWESKVR